MEKMNNVRIDPSDDEREKIPPCQEVDDSCSEMSGAPESCGFSPSLGSLESGQITISSEQFEAVVGLKERCDAQEEKLRALSEMRENEAKKADRTIEEFELKLREKDFALAEKEHELKAKTDALERSSLDLRQILEKSGKDSKKIYQMQASIELLKEEVAKWKDAVLKDTPENEDRSNKKKIRQLVLANQIANAKLKRHKTMLEHARNDILQQAEVIKNQNEVLSQLQAPDSSFKGELTKDTNVSLSLSEDMHVSEIKARALTKLCELHHLLTVS
ncbi:hypothetical protein AAMO2058_000091200 [Amorphochlora amoebiformis]